ncbi:MAG: RNA methyltransferase [Parcubacteria group bacterium CG_4_9_14_0_2_um_filter_41_8]|nr:MAG: RNA methyltransferase [Parcubacteria group bacterium CG22_combo_CG10-13_8_21_14_all_41_9]PIQ80250.1 MAG: RNA methyltransferase [Parcubacteria group bacterium CG11_big_fil_rev_8_21_14_0_20_41_14]PIR56889.1 MAG: RNA methyltransferase [Parcubacteria group bacterium CG10_big_fil_rev_8_21_14_0_10_41_35]PIZ81530.1 MAG: RNA methyltransferase [Parcubacteria group bacterium CG_4_10_14_0_2_um_filter_41_6]PJC40514.1 MAG: RNA methyltransferase [Parcubacteria group bacterium CG_4_9_14_0_2_um_filter_
MIAILHNIRSNHNVGSIFRTADALGIEKLYLCGITPSPVDRFGRKNSALHKVSLGAEEYIPWEHATSITELLDKLKHEGYAILALEQHKDSTALESVKLKKSKKYALVVGNEVEGLPQDILKRADEIVEIPMLGKKESLNVSVAFGVAVYQLISSS